MALGDERTLSLIAFAQTRSLNAARTNGNQALQDVITGATRIVVWVDEAGQPFLLVFLEQSPQFGSGDAGAKVGDNNNDNQKEADENLPSLPIFPTPQDKQNQSQRTDPL